MQRAESPGHDAACGRAAVQLVRDGETTPEELLKITYL